MKNVTVRAYGTQYADVATGSSAFGSYATAGSFNLDAHQTYITGYFRGRAKKVTGATAQIIAKARIIAWDASLDHILRDHTGPGAMEGKLSKTISPN